MLTLKIKAAANSVFRCTTATVEAATPLGVASVADLREREAAGGQAARSVATQARGVQAARRGAPGRGLWTLALRFGEGLFSPLRHGKGTTDSIGPGAGNGVRCRNYMAESSLSPAQGKKELLLGKNLWTFN